MQVIVVHCHDNEHTARRVRLRRIVCGAITSDAQYPGRALGVPWRSVTSDRCVRAAIIITNIYPRDVRSAVASGEVDRDDIIASQPIRSSIRRRVAIETKNSASDVVVWVNGDFRATSTSANSRITRRRCETSRLSRTPDIECTGRVVLDVVISHEFLPAHVDGSTGMLHR